MTTEEEAARLRAAVVSLGEEITRGDVELLALRSLVYRLWEGEHIAGYEWETADLDVFIDGSWFGKHDQERRLTHAEADALRKAIE